MFPADEHPFLDAILSRPSEDGARLVYADYLDETGNPLDASRAELIRVQIALARLPIDHPRHPELNDLQTELRRQYQTAWTLPLARLGAEFDFRRGIPDSVAIDTATFLRRGEELFDNTQVGSGRSFVRRICLREPARFLRQLANCALLARVEELSLCGGGVGDSGLDQLVQSPHLHMIRALDLGFNGLGDPGVTTFARTTALPRLQSLSLNDNSRITADGVAALANSPFCAGLQAIDLTGNDIAEAGVLAIVQGQALTRLHTLKLTGCHIGDLGLKALVRSNLFRQILTRSSHLELQRNLIGPAGAEALASSPELVRIAHLDLSENDLGDDGVKILAESGRLENVRTLRLDRNLLVEAGVVALIAAGLPKLRTLDVSGNRLTPRGVNALKNAARVQGFSLDASGNATEPTTPVPVAVADLVPGVLNGLIVSTDDIEQLKRRVSHPARQNR